MALVAPAIRVADRGAYQDFSAEILDRATLGVGKGDETTRWALLSLIAEARRSRIAKAHQSTAITFLSARAAVWRLAGDRGALRR